MNGKSSVALAMFAMMAQSLCADNYSPFPATNTIALHFSGEAAKPSDGKLYRVEAPEYFPVHLCAIPYALWQNRGPADMQIFLGIQ